MVMAATPGEPLNLVSSPELAAEVARLAGRDLALLNQVPARGFGFIRRKDAQWPPSAEFETYGEFVMSFLPRIWPGRLSELFSEWQLDALRNLAELDRMRPGVSSHLAHGDFDVTPIFQLDGAYTGLIDFGEMRGADPFFDLGHFLLHDAETYSRPLFDQVCAGYSEVIGLNAEEHQAIIDSGIMLGLRQLCRWLEVRKWPSEHSLVQRRARRLEDLLQLV